MMTSEGRPAEITFPINPDDSIIVDGEYIKPFAWRDSMMWGRAISQGCIWKDGPARIAVDEFGQRSVTFDLFV
jgi:hypothetical protein